MKHKIAVQEGTESGLKNIFCTEEKRFNTLGNNRIN